MNKIAKEILKIARELIADTDYIYDPDHKKKPAGGYHKTEKGWSKKEQKKENKSVKPVNKGLSDSHKQRIDSLDRYQKQKLSESKESKPEILDYLSNDEDILVRRNVAYNKNTSSETLDKLSNDEYQDVLLGVSSNENTSSETLDKLATGDENLECERLQMSVSKNPNTSTKTLKKLLKYEYDDQVVESAKEALKKRKQQQSKGNQNKGIDFSKMTPELRQKIEDWDIEDIKKFINWLHKNGYGKGMMPTEEEQI